MSKFIPAQPFPPGEYIQDELDARGWTRDDLSDVTGISCRQIVNIIQGKSGITADTALAIGAAFDQDPITWMNLQAAYELAITSKEQRDIERRAEIFQKVPVREIIKRGWVDGSGREDTDTLERAVCSFLGTERIGDDVNIPAIAAKKGTSYDVETAAQIAWYRRAFSLAENAPASRFDTSNLDEGLKELRALSAYPEDARRIPRVLSDIGIRLVLVESLKGTKIDGVAFWLNVASPVIALSLRYDRIDNLWHTMMHELVHIRNGDASPAVDIDMMADVSEAEKIVNEHAAQALIPKEKLDSFIQRVKPYYYQARVVQFAQANAVHPGIVVGQLQYRGELTYQQLRKLLPKVRHEIMPSAIVDGWGNTLSF